LSRGLQALVPIARSKFVLAPPGVGARY
jgi:hypothetical protein